MQEEGASPRPGTSLNALSDENDTAAVLDDQSLAVWLGERYRAGAPVGYIHGDYFCKVVDLNQVERGVLLASPEKASKPALQKLAQAGLLTHAAVPVASLESAQVFDPLWEFHPITSPKEIASLVDERLALLGLVKVKGRGRNIGDSTAHKVWTEAGGRCMFEGCADDLTTIPFYKKATRVGYLAHIVASDPRGPRGSQERSHALSDDPANIMLMCDKHHRLIDVVAPHEFPEERLTAMRQAHAGKVKRCLNGLKFPRAKAVVVLGNLAGISTHFGESDFREALHASGLVMDSLVEYIRRTNLRDERNSPGFWTNYLREHENQIRVMVQDFNNAAMAEDVLAVFPFHHIATLVLAGRILGEGRPIQVFQFHRQRGTWTWDKNAHPLPPDTFQLEGLRSEQADEVLVTLELTARVDEAALPRALARPIQDGRIPWLRITTPEPSSACIAHPRDLEQIAHQARKAINHVQDKIRATTVHLIAVSPASAVLRFGQMLQAGHHPLYVVYDRADHQQPFVPALSICGQDVSATDGHLSVRIPLR